MATSLTDLQTLVQHEARDNNLDISTAGLAIDNSNKIYRKLAGSLPWPEFRRTYTLTATLSTGTEEYAWAFTGSPIFLNIASVEVEVAASSGLYHLAIVPPTEQVWNLALNESAWVPRFYVRDDSAGDPKIQLRPLPSATQNGGAVKVTGQIEVTALASAATLTAFISKSADDALVHLIAANWLLHDGIEQYAQIQIQIAQDILQSIFGKDQVPSELAKDIANG